MTEDREYEFKINGFTPATIPMARLADYMGDFAKLLGYERNVHFLKVGEGSAALACKADATVVEHVEDRMLKSNAGVGPKDALQAIQSINRRLEEDKTDAKIMEADGADIIIFPGYRRFEDETLLRSFPQRESIDGIVQRVGRLGQDASFQLEDFTGVVFQCKTTKRVAQNIAPYIFETELRLYGTGKWYRNEQGAWALTDFFATDFSVLESAPLSEVVKELRAVQDSAWNSIADPWQELLNMRNATDEEP